MSPRLPLAFAVAAAVVGRGTAQTPAEFFETRVRPLLVEKCLGCHGDKKAHGGLRLDTRAAVLKGGETGPAAVSGDPAKSLLVAAIRRGGGELHMPPKDQLSDRQIADLERWVRDGLAEGGATEARPAVRATDLWSLRPVADPAPPAVKNPSWLRQPLDRFVLAKLEAKGLAPATLADKRTLVRRVTFDLTGLPPTPAEVEAFVADSTPGAYAALVDRLLASPAYGERWGRHWLDLVRYCDSFDSRGVGGQEDCADAWRYRDWVVRSLNADLPYDKFVRMQVAGDVLPLPAAERVDGIVATGMLALGNWGGGDADKEKLLTDIADDQVDVVTRSVLGLTVACARCHDHKFDPVSTKDYYALAGIFFSTHILPNVGPKTNGPPLLRIPLGPPPDPTPTATVLAKRGGAAAPGLVSWRGEADCPNVAANPTGKEAVFSTIRMPAKSVAVHPGPGTDVLVVWTAPTAGPVKLAGTLTDFDPTCGDGVGWEVRHVPAKGMTKKLGGGAVANGKAGKFADVAATVAAGDRVELAVKRGGGYECDTTGVAFTVAGNGKTWDFAADLLTALPKGSAKVGAWSVEEAGGPRPYTGPTANGAQEGGVPGSPHAGVHDVPVHVRGRYDRLGDVVPRRFPEAVTVSNPPTVTTGSGRKELADWLTRPDHPLTARVIANRVWQYHFGEGLVRTPSNFGVLGEPPTHPELLDHLATKLIAGGWSLKALHRYILLSATYQQSAAGDPATRAADPDNRLWGHAPRHRLEAEAVRDALLAVAGKLDRAGPGVVATRDFNAPRRTLYLMTIRSDRTGFGPLFDVADSTAPVDRRTVSTVAPQALFLMNHPFARAQAAAFADRVLKEAADDAVRLDVAHRIAFGRSPTAAERELGLAFVKDGGREAWAAWCHLLTQANEFVTVE